MANTKVKQNKTLRVGDRVLWAGAWGAQSHRPAVVRDITIALPGESAKDSGVVRREVAWSLLRDPQNPRRVVVDLDNDHWAYGFQLLPVALAAAEYDLRELELKEGK